MTDATEHAVAIELAKAQAAGTVTPLVEALLTLVAKLRCIRADDDAEVQRLLGIERAAEAAYSYHVAGRLDDEWDEWDAKTMIERMEALGNALSS